VDRGERLELLADPDEPQVAVLLAGHVTRR
jgi:hypothetical protein